MQLPRPGDTFEHKYEIKAELGRGGFAAVYRATDLEVRRDVAIKVLAPDGEAYLPGVQARFMIEARVLAGLKDPHTIRLFEFGESTNGLLYMVFQYVAGVDLATDLMRRGALQPEIAVHITVQVLHALAEAHAAGILHRDIKPANIMIHSYMGDEFGAKLLDFGIAKIDPAAGGVALTKTGAVVGTPRYMCPEQVFGEPLSPSSDVYSVGLVLYEMLVGHPAVEGDQREILKRHAADEVHRMPDGVVWPALSRVVERMTGRTPPERFPTAFEAIHALEAAMRARPDGPAMQDAPAAFAPPAVPAQSTAPAQVGTRTDGTRRAAIALAIGAGFGIVAVLFLTWDPAPRESTPAPQPQLPTALLAVTPSPTPLAAAAPDLGIPDAGAAAPDMAVETGCGQDYEWDWERMFPIGGGRTVRAYLPRPYDANRRHPVVLAFQPPYISNGQYTIQSGFTEVGKTPDAPIVLSLLPADRLLPWADPADEVRYVRRTLAEANRRYCLDPERLFAIGHDQGAVMAHQVACSMKLSGLSVTGHAEFEGPALCELEGVPMLRLQGRDDEFIPAKGGIGCAAGPYLSARAQDDVWRARNDCSRSTTSFKSGQADCELYSCRTAPYVSCLADGGHYLQTARWSVMWGDCPTTLLGADVATVVWPFFKKHGRAVDLDAAVTP